MKRKDLKKNKKGFTLIEIIVVLVIMGILLAVAVPAVLGYVGKAQESQYLSEARAGYLGAQTIATKAKATDKKLVPNDQTGNKVGDAITKDKIKAESGEESKVTSIGCTVDSDGNIEKCTMTIDGLDASKVVNVEANKTSEIVPLADAYVGADDRH